MLPLIAILIVLLCISIIANGILAYCLSVARRNKRKDESPKKESGENATAKLENGTFTNLLSLSKKKKQQQQQQKAGTEPSPPKPGEPDPLASAKMTGAAGPVAKKPEAVPIPAAPPSPSAELADKRSREEVFRSECENNAPNKPKAEAQRSERQILMEPIGRSEFSRDMQLVVDFINEYFDDTHKYSVTPEHSTKSEKLRTMLPERAESCALILEDMRHIVVKGLCHIQHPRYHAKFAGRCLADVISNTLASTLGFDLVSSPIIDGIERMLCGWLSQAFGLKFMRVKDEPQIVGGVTTTPATRQPCGTILYSPVGAYMQLINHCILRHQKSTKRNPTTPYVVYCSDDSNYFLDDACELMRVHLRTVPTKKEDMYGMTGKSLDKQIQKDKDQGLVPVLIIANYGSYAIAANDEVKEMTAVAHRRNIWIHIDASYAGCTWIDPVRRDDIHAALVNVHSVHINLSTMLPFSGKVTIIWSAEKMLPFSVNTRSHSSGVNHALQLWILIRMYGMRSLRESVKKKVMLGNMFSDRLTHHAEFFNVLHSNEHGITLFQYVNQAGTNRKLDFNKLTSMFYHYVNACSQMKLRLIRFQNTILIRSCINYERCNASQMEESVSTLLNLVEDFEEVMKRKKNAMKEASWLEYGQQIVGSPNESTEKTQEDGPL